jgi:hypothetical protein
MEKQTYWRVSVLEASTSVEGGRRVSPSVFGHARYYFVGVMQRRFYPNSCRYDITLLTRVNPTNVLNEGLRIREIGRRMNSKVKLVETGVYRK